MAKNDNLTDFLTDVANAIREKKGTSDLINPQDFSSEIASIKTGSGTDRLQWKCDNIKSLAYECYSSQLSNVDEMFNGLDTSKVTTMSSMFSSCSKLTSLDLSNFNTSQVTSMNYMFYGCSSLTTLDLSSFNTSNVTNMSSMFSGCSSLTTLDLSSLDTSSVTSMNSMFQNCIKLTSIDVSNFNTSKVANMYAMFNYCSSLTSIDASSFNTSNVTSMGDMFRSSTNLTSILGTLDLIKATGVGGMFAYCTNLTTFTLKNIKKTLQIGSGSSWGHLLDDPTVINTAKELWDLTGTTSQKLTVATAVSTKLDTIYVKLIDATEEMIANDPNITSKKPCEVCSETDEGAMTLREYIVSKNWTISG